MLIFSLLILLTPPTTMATGGFRLCGLVSVQNISGKGENTNKKIQKSEKHSGKA